VEAWILHINTQYADNFVPNKVQDTNEYSAWSTEKLALKAAGSYIKDIGHWCAPEVLRQAACALVDQDDIPLAIKLLHTYSKIEEVKFGGTTFNFRHLTITITKSTFSGSPFE
jgi:hypothetical protein